VVTEARDIEDMTIERQRELRNAELASGRTKATK
jgi:hypothetical protein